MGRYPDGEQDYLITEVKNSTNTKTIRQGTKETLEYLAFLQQGDEFVYGSEVTEGYFGDGWNGLLVIQDLVEETTSLEEQENEIKILQASEIERELVDVLQKFF